MDMNLILASIGVFLGIILLLVVILLVATVSYSERQSKDNYQWRERTGSRTRFNFAEHPVCQWHLPVIGLWW